MVAWSDQMTSKQERNARVVQKSRNWRVEHPYSPDFGPLDPTAVNHEAEDSEPKVYSASCYCGRVRYDVRGDPITSKLCHCVGCQLLHGAPFEWVAIFAKENVRFHPCSLQYLYFYNSTLDKGWSSRDAASREQAVKVSCSHCRSPVADEGRHNWLAFCTSFGFTKEETIPKAFQHSCHLFYKQRCIDVNDDKQKWNGHQKASSRWQPDWAEEE